MCASYQSNKTIIPSNTTPVSTGLPSMCKLLSPNILVVLHVYPMHRDGFRHTSHPLSRLSPPSDSHFLPNRPLFYFLVFLFLFPPRLHAGGHSCRAHHCSGHITSVDDILSSPSRGLSRSIQALSCVLFSPVWPMSSCFDRCSPPKEASFY